MSHNEYPKDFIIELEELHHIVGLIQVYKTKKDFYSEISLVFKENQKIFKHIGFIYKQDSEKEALNQAYLLLNQKLQLKN